MSMILLIVNSNNDNKHTALQLFTHCFKYLYLPSKIQWEHVKNVFLVRLQPLLDMDRWCLYVL